VIQLSPPIHPVESPDARQNVSLSPDREKAEEKEDVGGFARLLAGLLQQTDKSGVRPGFPGTEKAGTDKGPSLVQDAGETVESEEVSGNLEGSKKGKKRGTFPIGNGEMAEQRGKTDALSGAEKKRVKPFPPDSAEAEPGADAALALSSLETDEAAEGEMTAVQAGEDVRVSDGTSGGEEIPDADVPGKRDALIVAEAAEEDHSPREDHSLSQDRFISQDQTSDEEPSVDPRDRARDLPAGKLSQYVGEAPPTETPGPGRTSRRQVRETSEKDGLSPGEIRVRDRRRDRLTPEAGDIRVGLDKRDGAESAKSLAGQGGEMSRDSGRETELVVELRSMGKTQAEISADRENRPVQSFQNTLARELHENLNGDIVRHASVMLRDGGEGTIRLSLRPETLGSVKIRLEITENKITGRIIVESSEAFKAFEQELHSLEQSFRDSGFDDANLEMAFASDGQEGRRREETDSRIAALRYDAAVSEEDAESPEDSQWLGMRRDSQGRPWVNMLI
jgi:hypothetical protein